MCVPETSDLLITYSHSLKKSRSNVNPNFRIFGTGSGGFKRVWSEDIDGFSSVSTRMDACMQHLYKQIDREHLDEFCDMMRDKVPIFSTLQGLLKSYYLVCVAELTLKDEVRLLLQSNRFRIFRILVDKLGDMAGTTDDEVA